MFTMRVVAVYLIVLVLLAISIAAGYIAADWPHWCRMMHGCQSGWPPSLSR
jgi:hypothetical protein